MLARAQHRSLPGRAVLPLDYMVGSAPGRQAAAIDAMGLTVQDTSGQGGAWVAGSQALLSRLVENVIDNAICHNTDGGWISITTGTKDGRPGWSSRTAARSSIRGRSPSCPSRSGGWPPTGPAPTAAPASACPSSPPSPRPTAGCWTCRPGPAAGCASASRCRWPRPAVPGQRCRHEGPGRRGLRGRWPTSWSRACGTRAWRWTPRMTGWRPPRSSTSTPTTSWCSTVTCPASTAMPCAR